MGTIVTIGIVVAVVLCVILLITCTGYIKAPTDKAYIISGLRKTPKVIIGKSAIKIPFLQRVDKLELKLISVDVKTRESVPTNEYINVFIDSAVKIKISTEPTLLEKAAKNFLNKNEQYITETVVDVLEGNVREIIGQMKLEDIVTDRKKFAELVQQNASPDMENMGLEIVSFNVQNVTDEEDVIKNLGIDRITSIRKSAAISRAESERDITIAQAKATKEANDAEINAKNEIAIKNNELDIKQSELKKLADIKKAEADAAYKIQEEEQRKAIEITTANANIAKQEKEVELKEKEISIKEKTLDAEVRKQSEAEKYARQQKSDAELYEKQRAAEAKKYEVEQESEAQKLKAEADKYAKLQEAEGIKSKGLAEAEAVKAKGLAEAEAMEKKAIAYEKYGKAAMTEMLVQVLPEMAKAVAEPLTSIDKITIIDGGGESGNGVNQMGSYVPSILAKTIESIKETTGFDITEIMKADTYDAKTTQNINFTGLPEKIEKKVTELPEKKVTVPKNETNNINN